MTSNLYAMITTKSSNSYTPVALDSFFKSTVLTNKDEFVLIDNDNEGTYNSVPVIQHIVPKSFAENCNFLLEKANGRTLFLLSNDVAFTPLWAEPLKQYSNLLLLPSCNQTHLYSTDRLSLRSSMHLNEYNNQYHNLAKISQLHKTQNSSGFFERLLMGFYVFMLPPAVYEKVGLFDESFGVGGGEDVDYRLRAIRHQVPVKYVTQSYLLHFAGKSTWDGPEQVQEIEQRNKQYFELFSKKWGSDLANLCLIGGDPMSVIEKYNLLHFMQQGKFSDAIKIVLNG